MGEEGEGMSEVVPHHPPKERPRGGGCPVCPYLTILNDVLYFVYVLHLFVGRGIKGIGMVGGVVGGVSDILLIVVLPIVIPDAPLLICLRHIDQGHAVIRGIHVTLHLISQLCLIDISAGGVTQCLFKHPLPTYHKDICQWIHLFGQPQCITQGGCTVDPISLLGCEDDIGAVGKGMPY